MSLDELFKNAKGKPIIFAGRELVRIDRIPIRKLEHLRVNFLSTNSDWRQGIIMETKGSFALDNGMIIPSRIVLWIDTSPAIVNIWVTPNTKSVLVYNVWDVGNGTMHYWHNCAAMEVTNEGINRVYRCNDGDTEVNFDDIIFSIEKVGGTSPGTLQ